MVSGVANSLFYLPLTDGLAASRTASVPSSEYPSNWFIGDGENHVLSVLQDLPLLDSGSWPIVLYGPPLAGKSALGLSLVHRLSRLRGFHLRKNLKVIALTATDWSYQVRESLETDSLVELRNRLAQAGSILFDDLHGLETAPFAQSQLVTLLDLLRISGVPVVVTLPSVPFQLESLCPQLTSRLEGGLVLPVNLPGPAARRAFLESLLVASGVSLSDEALDWLAGSGVATNVVALRTMLEQIRVSEIPSKSKKPLSLSRIKQLIVRNDLTGNRDAMCRLIVEAVAEAYSLEPSQIRGASRRHTTVLARGICMTLIRLLTTMGFASIGAYFDRRDHSTTIHAVQKTLARIQEDSQFEKTMDSVFRELRAKAAQIQLPIPDSWKTCWLSVDSC